MPVDRQAWSRELHLSNFVNAYYEFRDLQALHAGPRVLVVGPGQGLGVQVLRWRGYDVVTYDIDPTFGPDRLGSVHDMAAFPDARFDAVLVSHVLEHLPIDYLDCALAEIARVGRNALVYLPVTGRHGLIRFVPGVRALDLRLTFDVFNPFDRPDGKSARYEAGMHYWEVGRRGFRVKDMLRRFSERFTIVRHYRNRDWLPSYNFVLRSKQHASGVATERPEHAAGRLR
jgi:SAM-dependent methyltransferase